jgi:hypothetical protein
MASRYLGPNHRRFTTRAPGDVSAAEGANPLATWVSPDDSILDFAALPSDRTEFPITPLFTPLDSLSVGDIKPAVRSFSNVCGSVSSLCSRALAKCALDQEIVLHTKNCGLCGTWPRPVQESGPECCGEGLAGRPSAPRVSVARNT